MVHLLAVVTTITRGLFLFQGKLTEIFEVHFYRLDDFSKVRARKVYKYVETVNINYGIVE